MQAEVSALSDIQNCPLRWPVTGAKKPIHQQRTWTGRAHCGAKRYSRRQAKATAVTKWENSAAITAAGCNDDSTGINGGRAVSSQPWAALVRLFDWVERSGWVQSETALECCDSHGKPSSCAANGVQWHRHCSSACTWVHSVQRQGGERRSWGHGSPSLVQRHRVPTIGGGRTDSELDMVVSGRLSDSIAQWCAIQWQRCFRFHFRWGVAAACGFAQCHLRSAGVRSPRPRVHCVH